MEMMLPDDKLIVENIPSWLRSNMYFNTNQFEYETNSTKFYAEESVLGTDVAT